MKNINKKKRRKEMLWKLAMYAVGIAICFGSYYVIWLIARL